MVIAKALRKVGWAGLASDARLYVEVTQESLVIHMRSVWEWIALFAGFLPGLGALYFICVQQYGGLLRERFSAPSPPEPDRELDPETLIPLDAIVEVTYIERHIKGHKIYDLCLWIPLAELCAFYLGHGLLKVTYLEGVKTKKTKVTFDDVHEARALVAALQRKLPNKVNVIHTSLKRAMWEGFANSLGIAFIPFLLALTDSFSDKSLVWAGLFVWAFGVVAAIRLNPAT